MCGKEPLGAENTAESFCERVYRVVCDIPRGRVATYGQIAFLLGEPHHARMVGHALATAPAQIPCHRVVNAQGRLAPHFAAQKELLLHEGVTLKENGCVRLTHCRWHPLDG